MRHTPVLTNEVILSLQLKPNANVIDCTLGDGGHAEMILEKIAPAGKLLGIDADPESILRAKNVLDRFGKRAVFARNNFVNLKKIIEETRLRHTAAPGQDKFGKVDGILLDLGWSSPQFEERRRGFSFQKDEPLDMRYDPNADNPTAGEMINNLSEKELEKIFREYGEEKLSGQIARLIIEKRKVKKITTTQDLVKIIEEAYKHRRGKIHPATKVFQALRVAVNNELGVLKSVLPAAVEALNSGGRLSVITFHSLEDRIVKHYFKGQDGKNLKIIYKKPIVCTDEEYAKNPRARSAKLRTIEKI